jgi:hypothetical protein
MAKSYSGGCQCGAVRCSLPKSRRAGNLRQQQLTFKMMHAGCLKVCSLAGWFAEHELEWLSGKAYRFAIQCRNRMIGVVDIGEISNEQGELGYWLEKSSWGKGYAFEADRDAITMVPVFVGFVDAGAQVILNEEHSEFRWTSLTTALNMVPFAGQRHVFMWTPSLCNGNLLSTFSFTSRR